VEDYREKGILPQALINFVALLGWNRGDDQEIFSLQELVESFSLERVNKAGAVFDWHKLEWMNGHYIRNISEQQFLSIGLEWMGKLGIDGGSQDKNILILKAVRPAINKFSELKEKTALFFQDTLQYEPEALDWIRRENSKALFKHMLAELQNYDALTPEVFGQVMKSAQKAVGLKGKELWMPVRAAITGMTHGPELQIVLTVLGKSKVEQFLKQAIEQ